MKKTLALVLALLPTLAVAQTFPTIPSQTVIGRTAFGPGPAQAIPFTQLSAQFCSNFTLTLKGCVPPPGATSGRYLSDDIVTPWKAIPTQAVTAGAGVSLGGTCSGTAINCQVSATAATQLVLPSRASAAGQDLSALSAIMTLGYATPGDGGSGKFKNVGSAAFIDSFVSTVSISGNGTSGCTNGTYFGQLGNGGTGFFATFTFTVSGNVVTAATLTQPGNAYTVGDIMSFSVTGCSTTVTITVTGVTTPSGSFTDTAGNHWQLIYEAAGLDVRSMGVKFDWNSSGGDGAATDNFTTLQNALYFAGYSPGLLDTGMTNGGRALLARNTAMICGSGAKALMVPNGVTLRGHGSYESIIKICDAWGTTTNYIELCNSAAHFACFNSMIEHLSVFSAASHDSGVALPTLAAVYSNACQQQNCGLRNVTVYPGACRQGLKLEIGYGGASYIPAANDVEFKGGKTGASCGGDAPMISINYGSTLVKLRGVTVSGLSGGGGGGPRDTGISITGGFVDMETIYPENVVAPITINIAGGLANGMVTLRHTEGGASCVGLVTLAATNTLGNFLIGGPTALNGCTRLVTNGQPAGANLTGPIISDTIFNP